LCIFASIPFFANSQCNNPFKYPSNTITTGYGNTIITTQQWAGDYNTTSGYAQNDVLTFSSSIPSDFITLRRASNNQIIEIGYGSVEIGYTLDMGNIEMHINKNSSCTTENVNRTTSVYRVNVIPCDANSLFPSNTTAILNGQNVITTQQYTDEYNVTTGYIFGDTCLFYSSVFDWIILKKANDNSIIAQGYSPSIIYNNDMGDIEMHVFISYSDCTAQPTNRTSYVEVKRPTCSNELKFPLQAIKLSLDSCNVG
ncbi:MAG: hypothetical protein RLZZ546_908, partial [Bacteroidota bacterium]